MQDLYNPIDPTLSSVSTDAEQPDYDDVFSAQISSFLDMSNPNDSEGPTYFPSGFQSCSTGSESLFDVSPVPTDTVSGLFAFSMSGSASKQTNPSSGEVQSYEETPAFANPCSCLSQALELMKQLSSPSAGASVSWTPRHLEISNLLPSARIVIGQKEATIDDISTLFECSYSQDGYLLTVLSLIIFKVLNWYAAVAPRSARVQALHMDSSRHLSTPQQTPQPSERSRVGNDCLQDTDSARMVAQLILSELHRVRRLVDLLSPKLKVQAQKEGRDLGKADGPEIDWEKKLPLPAAMYEQLDCDLRKRLSELSREMVGRLRRL
ncbi:MAG: hypothetical protein M1828_005952 [Chrysothrix sp. TS-e1954]|nr:MAG: hypothetical protein M1828_005952 [Chrysothrix sp. TS-e1954]